MDPCGTGASEDGCHVFKWVTDVDRRSSIRVVFTRSLAPYCADRELIDAVRAERVFEVTTAGCEPDRRHPLLACQPGGAYDRVRAVHDIVGHAGAVLGFDRDGEYTSWLIQDRQYRGLARWALAIELHGENSVRWITGDVAEHKAMLFPRDLVRRMRLAGTTCKRQEKVAEVTSQCRSASEGRCQPPQQLGVAT